MIEKVKIGKHVLSEMHDTISYLLESVKKQEALLKGHQIGSLLPNEIRAGNIKECEKILLNLKEWTSRRCALCGDSFCLCADNDCWAVHCMSCNNSIGKIGRYDPCAKSAEDGLKLWNDQNEKIEKQLFKEWIDSGLPEKAFNGFFADHNTEENMKRVNEKIKDLIKKGIIKNK
jgi:hypothetical protein